MAKPNLVITSHKLNLTMLQRQCFFFLGTFFILTISFSQQSPVPVDQSIQSTSSIIETNLTSKDSLRVKPSVGVEQPKDSLRKKSKFIAVKKEEVPVDTIATIDMYEIFHYDKSVGHVDTTLTIQKEYRNNYLRRDYFELLPFVNMGHAFNRLGYDFTEGSLQPQMGARSKHFSYFEIEDINYYRLPTPLTELFFRTTMEQGQLSDALISLNTSPQFNLAIAYRGMRSLGKYVNQRSSNEALRLSMNFQTKNERYKAKAHYVSQTLSNQENGGITDESIGLFESGDPDFIERGVVEVKLRTPENRLRGKRSFLDHHYWLVQANGESGTEWSVGHRIQHESKFYNYTDTEQSSYFGSLVAQAGQDEQVHWKILKNRVETTLANPTLGRLTAGLEYSTIDYFFRLAEEAPLEEHPTSLMAEQTFLNADYAFNWRGFDFVAHFNKTITGERLSDIISLEGRLRFNPDAYFEGKFSFVNKSPDFNFMRYRSNYTQYNWYNPSLENEKITSLSATLSHQRWGTLSGWLQRLTNYTYYNQIYADTASQDLITPDVLLTEVVQNNAAVNYLKLRYQSTYSLWKFALTTTAQYQKILNDNVSDQSQQAEVINVPEWNVRTTLSFSSDMFKKALFLQTGITGQYFSAYYADQYNPLLGDFMRQDRHTIGEFPRIDLFVNAKIQQTRLYFKYEHINSTLTGYDFYSAVGYPYRDRIIRFGIVWNFFQ